MTKNGRKTQEMRHVSFRMPASVHQDYVAVAQSRGVDLSALLNWILVEYWPLLLLRQAEHQAGMLHAAVVGLPRHAAVGPDPQDALDGVNKLIGQLQIVGEKLAALSGE
jgi:hypothetical protein